MANLTNCKKVKANEVKELEKHMISSIEVKIQK
jgi:hypothetical protein